MRYKHKPFYFMAYRVLCVCQILAEVNFTNFFSSIYVSTDELRCGFSKNVSADSFNFENYRFQNPLKHRAECSAHSNYECNMKLEVREVMDTIHNSIIKSKLYLVSHWSQSQNQSRNRNRNRNWSYMILINEYNKR